VQLQVLLQALQPLLKLPSQPQTNGVHEGEGRDSSEEDSSEPSAELSAEESERKIEAAMLLLDIVTVPDMPREVLVEEMLEDVLQVHPLRAQSPRGPRAAR